MKRQYLEAGKIVGAHGVRGELVIDPWTDGADFLRRFEFLYICGLPYKVLSCRIHKGMLIAAFEGIADRSAAMEFKGKVAFFDRGEACLAPGEFFLEDIIGANVVLEDGSEIGILKEILELPAGRVYVVCGKEEHMIPAVPEFVINTDASGRRITVRLIEGM